MSFFRLDTWVLVLLWFDWSAFGLVTQLNVTSKSVATSSEVCHTPACTEYAAYLRASMSKDFESLDPCNDFSKYACEGWSDDHEIRPQDSSVSTWTALTEKNKALLRSILESPYTVNQALLSETLAFDQQNYAKMRNFYDTCMDEETVRSQGSQPLLEMLNEFQKIYPLQAAKSQITPKQELTVALIWLAQRSVFPLITPRPIIDNKDPNIVILEFSPASLKLSRPFYSRVPIMNNYIRAVTDMFDVLKKELITSATSSAPLVEQKPSSVGQNVVNFERILSSYFAEGDSKDSEYYYQVRKLSALDRLIPTISFEGYLTALMPAGYKVFANRTVVVKDINYYQHLNKVIKAVPRDTLHDYFQWQIISTYADRLHPDFNIPIRQFDNVRVGRDPNTIKDRWEICIEDTDKNLGDFISGSFVQRAFPLQYKQLGDRMLFEIKSSFLTRLAKLDWMSTGTKVEATKKVAHLRQRLGYQMANPNVADPEELHMFYKSLDISNASYFDMGHKLNQFKNIASYNTLLKKTDVDHWANTAPTVNAYYSTLMNTISIPAGFLQYPFFEPALPDYVSYGAWGSIAGHELTHAFDTFGAKFDERGAYRNWWDPQTKRKFDLKQLCFAEQYSHFHITNEEGKKMKVNGFSTLRENIADAGGIAMSYDAWKKRSRTHPQQNLRLPGFEKFSNDQVFFLSYANLWCSKARPAEATRKLLTDAHAPAFARIIGMTENSEAFKKAFSCPVKKATCQIW